MGEAEGDAVQAELLRRVVGNPAFGHYARLAKVQRYVNAHLPEPVSLAEAARVAGLERCYFSTYFRQRAHICFRDWLSGLRTVRAMEMIREQDRPFSMVSDAVGFPSQRAFQRTFKKWTGGTAREYRKRVQGRLTAWPAATASEAASLSVPSVRRRSGAGRPARRPDRLP